MEDDWHTVHTRTKDKKQRQKERQIEKQDEPASKAEATAADPFAEFDRAFADKAAQQQQQNQNVFAELEVDDAPAAEPQDGAEEVGVSSADEGAAVSAAALARSSKKPKPKPVRKPKLTVAQVAAGKHFSAMRKAACGAQPGTCTCMICVSGCSAATHDHALVWTTVPRTLHGV
jgi:hypothetical protein